tara:strand:+ start:293 stop:415 length:123 start_codon:yes stop_codon:yes gene_type:complete
MKQQTEMDLKLQQIKRSACSKKVAAFWFKKIKNQLSQGGN